MFKLLVKQAHPVARAVPLTPTELLQLVQLVLSQERRHSFPSPRRIVT